jgi:hypothetical protein
MGIEQPNSFETFELVYCVEQLSMRKYLDRDLTQNGCMLKLL